MGQTVKEAVPFSKQQVQSMSSEEPCQVEARDQTSSLSSNAYDSTPSPKKTQSHHVQQSEAVIDLSDSCSAGSATPLTLAASTSLQVSSTTSPNSSENLASSHSSSSSPTTKQRLHVAPTETNSLALSPSFPLAQESVSSSSCRGS